MDLNFSIFYITSLENPKLHYKASKTLWETLKMKQYHDKKNLYFIEIATKTGIEFVFCDDSKSKWDNNNHSNYKLEREGSYIIFLGDMIPINKQITSKKNIIFTDLDGTLLGDNKAIKDFNKYWLQNFYFDKNKLLAYNSGRCISEILPFFNNFLIPPDFIIASTGSEVYFYEKSSRNYKTDEAWDRRRNQDWDPDYLKTAFSVFPFLKGCNFDGGRISFTSSTLEIQKNLDIIEETLVNIEREQKIKCKLVISGEGEHRYVDFLSQYTGKGVACEYICRRVNFPIENAVGFGDSMNDVEMLEMCGKAVMVRNSQMDLVDWFGKRLSQGQNVFFSEKCNAWALLEEIKGFELSKFF